MLLGGFSTKKISFLQAQLTNLSRPISVGQIFPFDTGNPDSLKVMRIFLGKTSLKILKKINKSPFSLCCIFYYQFAPLSLETYFVYSHTWKACAFDRIKSL